ncbi:hypothetical protein EON63_15620 [archaeon]|nr:MAG: hypothetical protein EON63_15620 [archaeon]
MYSVEGMCVGEKRVAMIPHLFGWEDHQHLDSLQLVSGRGVSIPKDTDLEFEIELQSFVDPPSKNANFFREMDSNFDNFIDPKEMER